MSLVLSGHYQWVLYLAALTAGLAAWCGVRLVQEWNGPPAAAAAAGLAFGLLPDSLGYSSQLLTDAMFGHLVLVWIYLLWTGLRTSSYQRLPDDALPGEPVWNRLSGPAAGGEGGRPVRCVEHAAHRTQLRGKAVPGSEGRRFPVRPGYPARVVLSLTEMADQLRAPGDRVFQVFAHRKLWWSGPLGSLLVAGLFGLALYGGYRRWRDGEPRPSLLTAGVLLFFLVTGSVSHLSGSRLRFPADLVSIPLTAIGFAGLIDRNARGVRLRSGT